MIRINDNFGIDADEHQFILKEFSTVKDEKSKNFGKETEVVLGYYTTLANAINGLEKILSRRMVKIKDYTLKEAVEGIKAIHDDVCKSVGEV